MNASHPTLGLRAAALDAVADAVCITDSAGVIVHVNAAFLQVTGLAFAEAVGSQGRDLLDEKVGAEVITSVQESLAAGRPWHGELSIKNSDGTCFLARCTCSSTQDEHTVTMFRDITKFREHAEAARRSAVSFRTLIEGSPDGVAVHRAGRFVYVNPAFADCLGHESRPDLVGKPLMDVVHPDDRDFVAVSLSTQEARAPSEHRLLRRDGGVVQVEIGSLPIVFDGEPAIVLTARDLSARRAQETRMREMDRMVSIGTLAAGIAHEINTPIQYVGDSAHFLQGALGDLLALTTKYRALRDEVVARGGYSDLLAEIAAEEEIADLPYIEEHGPKAIQRTLEGVERVSTIVRAMKEFGHPGKTEMAPADLNQAITNTITVACSEWKYVADVQTDLGPLPPVLCHLGSLNQVFLNLLVNASHAISDVVRDTENKGTIRITTTLEGGSVHIAVSDTGTGIPEAARGRIFDPFFTTKDVGKGTGQGLAIARSIVVEKHHGTIHFDTELGRGTTFHVFLPVGDA